jgi:hypothetical protein
MATFVNGLIFKPKHQNAPDFVQGKLSINVKNLREWLDTQTGEWINADIKLSKEGKYYIQVDEYKAPEPATAEPADDLPF